MSLLYNPAVLRHLTYSVTHTDRDTDRETQTDKQADRQTDWAGRLLGIVHGVRPSV